MSAVSSIVPRALHVSLAAHRVHAERVERWMMTHGIDAGSLEASVRSRRGAIGGGRMMIERVAPSAAPGLFDALGMTFGARARAIVDAAAEAGLVTILGWDASDALCAKLYVNASDASVAVRERLARTLGLASGLAPHVVGLNVGADAIEEKHYVQSLEAPAGLSEALRDRFAPWLAAGAVSGWVESRTRTEHGSDLRAVFVALRAGHPAAYALLASLPGWTAEAARAAAPFEVGVVRSIGIDVRGAPEWTAYFKPAEAPPDTWSIEPILVLRCRDASAPTEIGIFVEPASLGRAAWLRAGAHALSYRLREGSLARGAIDPLRAWISSRLAVCGDPSVLARDLRTNVTSPPEPWHVVDVS